VALGKIGWYVHLMGKTSKAEAFEGYDGFSGSVTLIRRKGRICTELTYHLALWKILLKESFDIVLFEPPQLRLIMVPAILSFLRAIRTRFVMDVRTPLVEAAQYNPTERLNYYLAMKFAKWVLPGVTLITEALEKDLRPLFGKKTKVLVWGSGVDEEMFNPSNTDADLRKKLGLEQRFVFFYHGALTLSRGVPELILALEKLSTDCPEAALVLLGDGASVGELKRQVYESGLTDAVFFLESVDNAEVPKYIGIADVGVIPLPGKRCWQVSSPLKLFEYMSMQVPMVVSDIEAHRAVLDEAPFVVYAKEVTPQGLCDAMKYAIDKISDLKMNASHARTQVEEKHSWMNRAKILSGFLSEVCM